MLAFSIWQTSPPRSFILFNLHILLLGCHALTVTKPEESSLPMLFVLVVLPYIHVSIGIDLTTEPFLLIVTVLSLEDTPVLVDSQTQSMLLFVIDLTHVDLVL